jgi:hypothetical protein
VRVTRPGEPPMAEAVPSAHPGPGARAADRENVRLYFSSPRAPRSSMTGAWMRSRSMKSNGSRSKRWGRDDNLVGEREGIAAIMG